ncbi:MAG: HAMP domain-containing sensor histidine kinase [Clostridiaceae bacterium]|nr:HAMP domain-containing sensor histidine kinase [Clostridiaceae bacterium]
MKGLFFRNFVIYAIVILVSFSALGSTFAYQINRFALQEKMNMLSDTMERATESTVSFLETSTSLEQLAPAAKLYRTTMTQLAKDAQGVIFITDTKGEMLLVATTEGCYSQQGGYVPQKAVSDVINNGSYYEISDFNGYLSSSYFVSGKSAVVQDGAEPEILVFAAIPSDTTLVFFVNILSTFFFMTVCVLVVTLIVTYFITWSSVKPLKQIAMAAKQFARGDYSARISRPSHHDEIYEMAMSFNNMAESISKNESMRRDLIANVSHDLRTPMTTIGGFVDGILDGTIPPEKEKYYLGIVSSEIKRLSRLANGMLTVSKLESNDELVKAPFDFSEMVYRIAFSFEQKINEKNVSLDLDIPESCSITANHDAMFQVVYNLFDNALKFVNQDGSIKIYISLKGGKLQFHIQNTGGEIDPESLKYIFERFYKSDKSRGNNPNGSGLGLYIAKTIIGRHGGDISAKSADGKTEFCFNIPIS